LAEPSSALVKGNNRSEERSIVGNISGLTRRFKPSRKKRERLNREPLGVCGTAFKCRKKKEVIK
jgi:hypothetical protein